MYTASISRFIGLLPSICSISIAWSVSVDLSTTLSRDVLVTFSLSMSSSLTTPSTIRLLPASKTTTFHCTDEDVSLIVSKSWKGTAYFSSSCRPHSLKNDYKIRSRIKMVYASSYLLSCCRAIAEVPIVATYCGLRGNDALSSEPTAAILKSWTQRFLTSSGFPAGDSDPNGRFPASLALQPKASGQT